MTEQKGKKIGIISLGCPKNQVDAELMLYRLREAGYEITPDEEKADAIIVNTCGFIEDAKKEAIDAILETAALKAEGRLKALIVTGCLAERYQDEMAKELPEIDVIVGIGANREIVSLVEQALEGERAARFAPKAELEMEGGRVLTTPPYTAYLRVADGCDNRCTYCAIPLIRGGFRSRKMEDIVKEAEELAANGVKELVVIAQDTSRYGLDLYGELRLPALLSQLCAVEGVRWIRILYAYPDTITDELLDVMAKEEKILPYLDIPLQHCEGRVLKAMNRRGDRESLSALLNRIRSKVPGIALRTTLIAGFPGETEEEFSELADFVRTEKFARMGSFAYSPEEDTPAAEMDGQVPNEVKARRQEILMTEQAAVTQEWNQARIGSELTVLVEGYDRLVKRWYGRTIYDAPEIDAKVFFEGEGTLRPGDFATVQIEDFIDCDLLGKQIL